MTRSPALRVAALAIALTMSPAASSAATADPAATTTRPDGDRGTAAERAVRTGLARWSTGAHWRSGTRQGVAVDGGTLRIAGPVGVRRFRDPYGAGKAHRYAYGRWTSPWVRPGFAFRDMIPSWSATSAGGTWLQPEVRVRTRGGRLGGWDVLGHWQGRLTGLHDASLGSQGDDVAAVAVDTVRTDVPAAAWQLRLTLYRPVGTARTPVVASATGVASTAAPAGTQTSRPGSARGRVLAVPRLSQMIHKGHYPQWGGGGEAWCSPTSMAMVLASWGRGPTAREYAWVKDSYRDPEVEHAARMVYDHRYEGTGNWPFTAAYAGTRGLDAYVTRLGSLRAAEHYIRAGIPLVLSIAFGPGELDGTPIGSSDGHLLVLRGFTEAGQPVVNDPAAARNASVRRVYKRGQLERAWITSTAGTAYVARPAHVALPRHR